MTGECGFKKRGIEIVISVVAVQDCVFSVVAVQGCVISAVAVRVCELQERVTIPRTWVMPLLFTSSGHVT
jgi:hypothetical protein